MNYDQYTVKAQNALQDASVIAQQNDHSEVGTEHLLYALLQQDDGMVPPLVERIGGSVNHLMDETQKLLDTYPRISGAAQISMSGEAAKILAKAAKVAKDAEDGVAIPETFKDYLDKWVYSVKDNDELLDKIGGSRLMRLKNEPHLGYSTRH